MKVQVKLDPGAFLPKHGHDADAGWDLCAKEDFVVPAGGHAVHDTGVHMAVPEGYCGLLVSKSGLNVKHSLTSTGLLDAGYTGSIIVKIYSEDTGRDYMFKAGDKISQIVILPIPKVELEVVAELDDTERGEGRMGSTGR